MILRKGTRIFIDKDGYGYKVLTRDINVRYSHVSSLDSDHIWVEYKDDFMILVKGNPTDTEIYSPHIVDSRYIGQ